MRIRPTTAEDAEDLLALVHASDMEAVGFADFDPSDVDQALKSVCSVVAVIRNDSIMGWGYLDNTPGSPRDFLEVYVHPQGGLPAQRPLLALLLEKVAQRGTHARAAAIPTETEWIASLEGAGFRFKKQYARMGIDLPVEVPAVAGVIVRLVEQTELPEFHRIIDSAFQDTPDYQHRSYEQFRERFIDDQQVDWDEWLIATVEGQPAGVLQSKASDGGWVQNLAVLREHRNRGVGRALLGEAFRIYAAKGHKEAGLGVDLANPTEAIKLYTGVGMTPAYQSNIYEL